MNQLKRWALVILIIVMAFPAASLAFQETHAFNGLLEYTLYDEGRWQANASDPNIQYHYPDAGGMLMVQCTAINVKPYTEEMCYSSVFQPLLQSSDSNSQNPVRYWEKRFICGGYYALRSKATYTVSESSLHDDTYLIATPSSVVTLHFVDSVSLGAYPTENIPYIVSSLHFLYESK